MGARRLVVTRFLQCATIQARGFVGTAWTHPARLQAAPGFTVVEKGTPSYPVGLRSLAQVATRAQSSNLPQLPRTAEPSPAQASASKEWFKDPSLDATALSKRLRARIQTKNLPPVTALVELICRCQTPEDIAVAAQATAGLHAAMSAIVSSTHQAFPENVTNRLVQACCKAGVPQQALRMVRARGVYGLVLPQPAMTQLMRSLSAAGNGMGVLRVYAEMRKAGVELPPTLWAQVAGELVSAGEPELALAFVDECVAAGRDMGATLETQIHAAADAGLVSRAQALLAEHIRTNAGALTAGLPFAAAKVHLLLGDGKAAVETLRPAMDKKDANFSDGVVFMLRQLLKGLAKREPASFKESSLVKTIEAFAPQLQSAALGAPSSDAVKDVVEEMAALSSTQSSPDAAVTAK
eukprot:jgi/Mesvir1/10322/Mv06182-RA.1